MEPSDDTHSGGRVLVVDDDDALRQEVASFLAGRGFAVDTADSVPAARRLMGDTPYDLFLLDLVMPGTTGKVLCREIAETSRAGIIMVSSVSDDAERIALLELGADDYIVKPFNMLELLARVRAFFRRSGGGAGPTQRVTRFGPWRMSDDERNLNHDDGRVITLTSSEAHVMRYLAANPNLLCTREDLLAVARTRQHSGTSDRSVDTLMRRLRTKIEPDPAAPRFIETEWGKGYVFRPG